MTKDYLIASLYRACEMLVWCAGMSVVICALCISGFMPVGSMQRDITLIIAPIAFIVLNFIMLRAYYAGERGKDSYYIISLSAYAFFAVISLGVYFLCQTDVYTWLFVVTRFARYSRLGISSPVAIGLFHMLLILSVFLAPVGMDWVREKEEEKQRYIEKMPSMLDINPPEKKSDASEVVNDEKNKTKEENSLS